MRIRALTVLAFCLVALGGPAVAPAPAQPAPAPAGPVELETPVFSLRRVPAYVSRVVADRRLTADLERALDDPVLGGARERTCLAVSAPDGRPVFARRPDLALIPASTLKVLTGVVALARIGPDARLTTEVRGSGPPRDGVVADLWLVGGGDPLLATADFAVDAGYAGQPRLASSMEALADLVVNAGVRRVEGRILGDESRYDTQRLVPSWNPGYIAGFEVSPLSALVVNKNLLVGTRAFGPPPPAHAASVLATLLRARGVAVGATGEGKAPADAVRITALDSPPLAEVVGEVLQHSDNLGAEMLVKELGFRFGGSGSTAAGLAVVRDHLSAMGVSLDGLTAVDGSGLDRSDRLSCDILQRVLSTVGEGSPLSRVLPVAGGEGTLYRRFLNTPAAGKVRAKTGSLQGVAALSGWATAASGRWLPFSLLSNDLPTAQVGAALQDKVVNALARYPQAPPPEELGPRPVGPAQGAARAAPPAGR